ncbi:MAG TPA: DUF4295 domain-containing protein [Flavobacteriaceae bacterium]|nr:DUF4295 domain-containing protein [Flavobacteriaceae bacterium]
MAKKPISKLRSGSKRLTKAIKMVKSEETGAYVFVEAMMSPDFVDDWFKDQE